MYPIEVLTSDATLVPAIERAMTSLNVGQKEFNYHQPQPHLDKRAYVLDMTVHKSGDLFAWLRKYRADEGGHRPFIMLIVRGRLATPRYENAFGSVEASEGLAVFTVHDRDRFVADTVRYIRYYLVRYTLSFVGKSLVGHTDTRGCFFDRKEYKPDISASLRAGGLCEEHEKALQPYLTPHSKAALSFLRKRVSEDIPYALVMKGGGVKGLALVGALEVLADRLSFDEFVGTSAGAIAAVLLAAGYTPAELRSELSELDFRDFCRTRLLKRVINFARFRALHDSRAVEEWVNERLTKRLADRPSPVQMGDLPSRAVVYCASPNGLLAFDSRGDRATTSASFAVQCSAAIPVFFRSPYIDGVRAFDGGMKQNFPLAHFLRQNPNKQGIGLYLKPKRKRSHGFAGQVVEAIAIGDEPAEVRTLINQIVVIDPNPIDTTDFDLSADDKTFLLAAGRAAAMHFLVQHFPDDAPSAPEVEAARESAERLRAQAARRWRRPI
jgi:predicted acylesterase/phospholipase RssA